MQLGIIAKALQTGVLRVLRRSLKHAVDGRVHRGPWHGAGGLLLAAPGVELAPCRTVKAEGALERHHRHEVVRVHLAAHERRGELKLTAEHREKYPALTCDRARGRARQAPRRHHELHAARREPEEHRRGAAVGGGATVGWLCARGERAARGRLAAQVEEDVARPLGARVRVDGEEQRLAEIAELAARTTARTTARTAVSAAVSASTRRSHMRHHRRRHGARGRRGGGAQQVELCEELGARRVSLQLAERVAPLRRRLGLLRELLRRLIRVEDGALEAKRGLEDEELAEVAHVHAARDNGARRLELAAKHVEEHLALGGDGEHGRAADKGGEDPRLLGAHL